MRVHCTPVVLVQESSIDDDDLTDGVLDRVCIAANERLSAMDITVDPPGTMFTVSLEGVVPTEGNGVFTYCVDDVQLPPGVGVDGLPYGVSLAGVDLAGNRGTSTPTDTAGPLVQVVHPASAQTFSGTILVTVAATDESGIVSLGGAVDGDAFSSQVFTRRGTTRVADLLVDTGTLSNGLHVITARATDFRGNQVIMAPFTFNVNNPLGLSVTSVTPPAPADGVAITIAGSGFDPSDLAVRFPFGAEGSIEMATTTAIVVRVPPGAVAGNLTVASAGATVDTPSSFQSLATRYAPRRPAVGGPPVRTNNVKPLVSVKFREGTQIRYRDGVLVTLGCDDLAPLHSVLADFGVEATAQRTFVRTETRLAAEQIAIEQHQGREIGDLNLFYRILTASPDDAIALANALNALDIVERAGTSSADVGGVDTGDTLPNPTRDLRMNQKSYRSLYRPDEGTLLSTFGVGADFINAMPGGRGQGVRLVDVETAWIVTHEDFDLHPSLRIPFGDPTFESAFLADPLVADPPDDLSVGQHGLSVLAILAADDDSDFISDCDSVDGCGLTGIASGLDRIFLSPHHQNVGGAIDVALPPSGPLRPGDILLLEVGVARVPDCFIDPDGPEAGNAFPAECNQAVFDSIARATALGIVVVEAAGNGRTVLEGDDRPGGGLSVDTAIKCSGGGDLSSSSGASITQIEVGGAPGGPVVITEICDIGEIESDRRGFDLDDVAFHLCSSEEEGDNQPCFNRKIRDSGAIFVGAGLGNVGSGGSERLLFSNFGSRVDVHAQGLLVYTAGCIVGAIGEGAGECDGNTNDFAPTGSPGRNRDQIYYPFFAGTSSAAAIVAGGVAALQGVKLEADDIPFGPFEMRDVVHASGQPQVHVDGDAIGPQIDLEQAVQAGILTPSVIVYEPDGTHVFLDLLAADFNADDITDFVVVDGVGAANIHVLLGSLGGGVQDAIPISSGGTAVDASSERFVSLFIDADGAPDLAIRHQLDDVSGTPGISVLENIGAGLFSFRFRMAAPDIPANIRDFDVLDVGGPTLLALPGGLAVPDFIWIAGNELSVVRGSSFGFYDPSTAQVLAAVPGSVPVTAKHLVSGDFNGDGILDIVVGSDGIVAGTTTSIGTLSFFEGVGDGTFLDLLTIHTAPTLTIDSLAAGDVDGDGALDIVVGSGPGVLGPGEDVVFVVYGGEDPPDGSSVIPYPASGCCFSRDVVIGDLNSDGLPDIAVATAGLSASISVLFNEGERAFQTVQVQPEAATPRGLVVANFDNDLRNELGFLDFSGFSVWQFGYIDMVKVPSQGPRAIEILE